MESNRIEGIGHQVKGAVMEGLGKAIGDAKLAADGAAERVIGGWIPTRSATPSTALVPQRKVGFPIPNAGLLLGFQGTKTARRKGISSPFSDPGGCTSPQNSGRRTERCRRWRGSTDRGGRRSHRGHRPSSQRRIDPRFRRSRRKSATGGRRCRRAVGRQSAKCRRRREGLGARGGRETTRGSRTLEL